MPAISPSESKLSSPATRRASSASLNTPIRQDVHKNNYSPPSRTSTGSHSAERPPRLSLSGFEHLVALKMSPSPVKAPSPTVWPPSPVAKALLTPSAKHLESYGRGTRSPDGGSSPRSCKSRSSDIYQVPSTFTAPRMVTRGYGSLPPSPAPAEHRPSPKNVTGARVWTSSIHTADVSRPSANYSPKMPLGPPLPAALPLQEVLKPKSVA